MNRLILLVIGLLSSLSCYGQNEFYHAFDIDTGAYRQTADRLASYEAGTVTQSRREQLYELQALAQNLDTFLKIDANNPVLHFLKGLNNSLLISAHQNIDATTTDTEKLLVDKIAEYRLAMELDKHHQPHLSAAMYATMKHGLEGDLKIQAIQNELQLGGNGDSESAYWFLHWSNINALQQAGRQQEAEAALQNMKQELAEKHPDDTLYQSLLQRIDQELHQPVSQPAKAAPATAKENTESEQTDTRHIIIWVIASMAILAIVFVTLYELFLRKHR